MPYQESLAKPRIEALIEDRGWNHEQFTERIDISPTQLSKWKRSLPKLEGLIVLAEGLGVTVDYIVGYYPKGKRPKPHDAGLDEARAFDMERTPVKRKKAKRRSADPDPEVVPKLTEPT